MLELLVHRVIARLCMAATAWAAWCRSAPVGETSGAPLLSPFENVVTAYFLLLPRYVDTVLRSIAAGQALEIVLERADGLMHDALVLTDVRGQYTFTDDPHSELLLSRQMLVGFVDAISGLRPRPAAVRPCLTRPAAARQFREAVEAGAPGFSAVQEAVPGYLQAERTHDACGRALVLLRLAPRRSSLVVVGTRGVFVYGFDRGGTDR
ncbi:hypothetical protein ACFCWY_33805 [Streptomyces sp. NPDC056362]|uniref:hypothetical protein n=1 Tax=unclassified Streptomyces TaxID=2593676 RepID=UPI0035DDADA2